MATEIALARRQKVFAVLETTPGTLVFPTAADYVRPAGDALITQTPGFTDSKEKADSLDVMDQFTNALPPGDWSCPMYLRTAGYASAVQGHAILKSLLGGHIASGVVDASLAADIAIGATTLTFQNLADGIMPPVGVVTIGSEKIKYTGVTMTTDTAGSLTGLTRGYNGTTAAAHTTGAAVTLTSQYYYPTQSSPAFSLWVQSDHSVFFLAGSTCNNSSIPVKNEDGVTFTVKGQGMRMGWAGTDSLHSAAIAGATSITVEDGNKYTVGARIFNKTKADYATAGYAITAVVGDVLTITPGVVRGGGWEANDVIAGYLPDPGVLASDVVENRLTSIFMDGSAGRIRTTDLTIDCPKNYLSDEVGTQYVSEFVEDMRKVSFNTNAYFKKNDLGKFKTAADAVEVKFDIYWGDVPGKTLAATMPRVKINVPTLNFDNPTMSLNTQATALGTKGEDSIYLVLL